MQDDILEIFERRLGRVHARQRLGIETENEARVLRGGLNFLRLENWYAMHAVIRNSLRLCGLYGRGRENSARIEIRHNLVALAHLPRGFDGFTILHISDMHVDLNPAAMARLVELLPQLSYDVCVLTGDYRGKTHGPYAPTLLGMARVREQIKAPIYAVLGNHDTLRMVPDLEQMGIQVLLNESVAVARGGECIYFVGIDDAHYFRLDNIDKAVQGVPTTALSVLLSHTPEIFRHAAHAEFDLLLAGHTHGGQICLPGGIPVILESDMPRCFGSGAWSYKDMQGYTSVGVGTSVIAVRFNCPPEITLHRLQCSA